MKKFFLVFLSLILVFALAINVCADDQEDFVSGHIANDKYINVSDSSVVDEDTTTYLSDYMPLNHGVYADFDDIINPNMLAIWGNPFIYRQIPATDNYDYCYIVFDNYEGYFGRHNISCFCFRMPRGEKNNIVSLISSAIPICSYNPTNEEKGVGVRSFCPVLSENGNVEYCIFNVIISGNSYKDNNLIVSPDQIRQEMINKNYVWRDTTETNGYYPSAYGLWQNSNTDFADKNNYNSCKSLRFYASEGISFSYRLNGLYDYLSTGDTSGIYSMTSSPVMDNRLECIKNLSAVWNTPNMAGYKAENLFRIMAGELPLQNIACYSPSRYVLDVSGNVNDHTNKSKLYGSFEWRGNTLDKQSEYYKSGIVEIPSEFYSIGADNTVNLSMSVYDLYQLFDFMPRPDESQFNFNYWLVSRFAPYTVNNVSLSILDLLSMRNMYSIGKNFTLYLYYSYDGISYGNPSSVYVNVEDGTCNTNDGISGYDYGTKVDPNPKAETMDYTGDPDKPNKDIIDYYFRDKSDGGSNISADNTNENNSSASAIGINGDVNLAGGNASIDKDAINIKIENNSGSGKLPVGLNFNLDTDGDGIFDAFDFDGDGIADDVAEMGAMGSLTGAVGALVTLMEGGSVAALVGRALSFLPAAVWVAMVGMMAAITLTTIIKMVWR